MRTRRIGSSFVRLRCQKTLPRNYFAWLTNIDHLRMAWLFRSILLLLFLFSNYASGGLEKVDVGLGRSIYEDGVGRGGREIVAMLHGGVVLKGGAVACAGCHGVDGRGSGEAFVRAPDIRWFSLSKPYSARRAGTAGTPYDSTSFASALRSGRTARGKPLDPAMPRFDLADDEILTPRWRRVTPNQLSSRYCAQRRIERSADARRPPRAVRQWPRWW